jgi:hypothetical protein
VAPNNIATAKMQFLEDAHQSTSEYDKVLEEIKEQD